jgi:hypothetical protein
MGTLYYGDNAERWPRGRADVVLDKEHGLCILYSPDPYDIDLDDLRTEAQLEEWAAHLAEKSWVTEDQLTQFVKLVADYRGFAPSQSGGDDADPPPESPSPGQVGR